MDGLLTPIPVGSYIVAAFQITGYDKDYDGSPIARLSQVDKFGNHTGWEDNACLDPDTDLVVEHPSILWELPHTQA